MKKNNARQKIEKVKVHGTAKDPLEKRQPFINTKVAKDQPFAKGLTRGKRKK